MTHKKLFIHIPKNAGMTIRGSESFLEHIIPVHRKWIVNFKFVSMPISVLFGLFIIDLTFPVLKIIPLNIIKNFF